MASLRPLASNCFDFSNSNPRRGSNLCRISDLHLGLVAAKRIGFLGVQDDEAGRIEMQSKVRSWLALKHPNILRFHGTLVLRDTFYLLFDFAHNGSLCGYMKKRPKTDRLFLVSEALAGLAYLHEQGIVHGRIKASNVLITDDAHAHALVSDFDIPTGSYEDVIAYFPWMSPECLAGGGQTFASDVWAVGMLIYEALNGNTPFHDIKNWLKVAHAITSGQKLPPQEPKCGFDGNSYLEAWNVASLCWERNQDKRIGMGQACNLLPVQSLDESNLRWTLLDRGLEPRPALRLAMRHGTIYHHPTLGKVHVKYLREYGMRVDICEYRRIFQRQSNKWVKLMHPHVCQYHGFVQYEDFVYWVTTAGQDVQVYLRQNPNTDRLTMLADIASGLAYLHAEGFIHGSVKASNVHILDDGRAVIGGWGWRVFPLMHSIHEEWGSEASDHIPHCNWACPEFDRESFASDVWAFGMLIYELLSGEVPYSNYPRGARVVLAINRGELPPTEPLSSDRGVSYEAAWDVATKCWASRASDRITIKEAERFLRDCQFVHLVDSELPFNQGHSD